MRAALGRPAAAGRGGVPARAERPWAARRSVAAAAAAAAAAPRAEGGDVVVTFAANTDCGKTVVSAGLVRAALRSRDVLYVKPVQTGVVDAALDVEGDAAFVRRWSTAAAGAQAQAGAQARAPAVQTLFCWPEPVSPHLAARLARGERPIPSSAEVLRRVAGATRMALAPGAACVVETAGGVLSPLPDGALQADAYARLFSAAEREALGVPGSPRALLVGDARLGGISATLAAYEALLRRGVSVDAVAFVTKSEAEERLEVADFVEDFFKGRVLVARIKGFPENPRDPLHDFYAKTDFRPLAAALGLCA